MNDQSDFYKQVGDKIRSRRGGTMSQETLASAVGLTRTSISNIESGRQKMLLHTFVEISRALKTDTSALLPEPAYPSVTGVDVLSALSANERAYIQSAIGITTPLGKGNNGRQKEKNSGTDAKADSGGGNHRGTRPRLGDRKNKRRAYSS